MSDICSPVPLKAVIYLDTVPREILSFFATWLLFASSEKLSSSSRLTLLAGRGIWGIETSHLVLLSRAGHIRRHPPDSGGFVAKFVPLTGSGDRKSPSPQTRDD